MPTEPKPSATARCAFCDWKIEFRGYDAVEAATFLHARLEEHARNQHADKVNDQNMLTAFNIGGELTKPETN